MMVVKYERVYLRNSYKPKTIIRLQFFFICFMRLFSDNGQYQ